MKTSIIASVSNFILPGSGLWYLGEHRRAIWNFVIAAAINVTVFLLHFEQIHYVLLAIAAGSAGYAHAISTRQVSQ